MVCLVYVMISSMFTVTMLSSPSTGIYRGTKCAALGSAIGSERTSIFQARLIKELLPYDDDNCTRTTTGVDGQETSHWKSGSSTDSAAIRLPPGVR